MIYTAPDDDVDIPRVDVASFVLELADEQATSPALIDGPTGTALTYGELAERVRALAAGLASRGFGHGDVLGVYMPNLPEYAVAFHAAAAAGGMCTTMNPLYTAREAADQLVDSGARMLLTIPAFAETAREAAAAASVEAIMPVKIVPNGPISSTMVMSSASYSHLIPTMTQARLAAWLRGARTPTVVGRSSSSAGSPTKNQTIV